MDRWRIASRVDHPDPAAANGLALADLEGGADALVLVSAESPGAFGFGLNLAEPGTLDTVLKGVSIDLIDVRLDLGRDALAVVDRLVEMMSRRGHPPTTLDVGLDPVGALVSDGVLPGDWPQVAQRLTECVRGLLERGFTGPAVRADGRPWHAAGASDAQELAVVVSTAVLYLRTLAAGGADLGQARSRLSFGLVADSDLVATVAKFRACRRLWACVETAFGLDPRPIRLHGETAWRSMTAIAPHTNIVRSAAATAAGVLGGADGMTVLPHTLAVGLPDADARRIARNMQHVLADESQLWRVADPAAGADVFEAATLALCEQAWDEVQAIERDGGIVASLLGGHMQRRVEAVGQHRRDRLVDGRDVLVGASRFRPGPEPTPVVLPVPRRPARPTDARIVATPLPPARSGEALEHLGDVS